MKLFFTFSLLYVLTFKAQNNALNFDGMGDDVTLPYTSVLDFSLNSKFSIEGWFKTQAYTAVIYSNLIDLYPFTGHEVAIVNTKLVFSQCNTDLTDMIRIETVNAYNDGNWHHFACVYKGIPNASAVDIYVDGNIQLQNVTSNNLAGAINSMNEPHMGSRDNTTYFMNGSLDEIRVWGIALTSEEVVTRKNCQLAGNETGLLAYFNFNQGIASGNNSGITSLPDVSGHNQAGSLTGFALTGPASNFIASTPALTGTCSVTATMTALQELAGKKAVLIAPNPGTGYYTLSGLKAGALLELYNFAGALVYKSLVESEELKLDISSFTTGIYIVSFKGSDNILIQQKLVKE